MNFSRVKTIFIILFACVNIVLLAVFFGQINSERKITRDAIEKTVSILENNHITVDKNLLDIAVRHASIVEVENVFAETEKLAGGVLGTGCSFDEGEGVYKSQDGLRSARIEQNAMDYRASAQPFAQRGENKEIALIHGRDWFLNLGVRTMQLEEKSFENGIFTVQAVQNIGGLDLFDSGMEMQIASDGVTSAQGFFAIVRRSGGAGRTDLELRHITSVLVDLINHIQTGQETMLTITEIRLGYSLGGDLSRKMISAVPCYRVVMDNGTMLHFDAVSGEFLY